MKICPFCGAENRLDARTCYSCGRSLYYEVPSIFEPGPGDSPTQPHRIKPNGQPRPQTTVPGDTIPGSFIPAQTDIRGSPSPSGWDQGARSYQPPDEWNTQPRQSVPQLPPAQVAPLFPKVMTTSERDNTLIWRIVAGVLIGVLICAAIFALYTMGLSLVNGAKRTAGQLATQVADAIPNFGGVPDPGSPSGSNPGAEIQATPEPTRDLTRYLTPECASALDRLSSANQKFKNDPASPFDAAWRNELSSAVEDTKTFCGSIDRASPVPEQIGEAHRSLTLATESFDQAGVLLKEGADNFEPAKFVQAGQELVEAGKYLGQALEELDKIGE
jgi:hypothetical protein